MAIRIREVEGKKGSLIALCAAEHEPQQDDVYLDDNVHHALSIKFHDDFLKEGLIKGEKWGE